MSRTTTTPLRARGAGELEALSAAEALPLSLWGRLAKSASSFFAATDVECADPLVDVVRRDSAAASWFIKVVMLFGGIGGAVVGLVCAAFLSAYWSRCGSCDRPLRWWLLVHALLQLTQVPVRFVFIARLRVAEGYEGGVEECVASITASPAWRTSKNVSLVTYAWFVLGVVWIMNAGNCESCPGIYRLTIAVILQAVARVAVALFCFRLLFLQAPPPGAEAPKAEGASQESIAAVPLVAFTKDDLMDETDATCAVCLCGYDSEELLRQLPCGHKFHRLCADKWLKLNKKCPLCMGPIDAPPPVGSWGKRD